MSPLTLRLILGDQLNPVHPWFQRCRDDVVYVLMELRQETDYVRHHAQKILAIFAGMRDLARQLREQGHRVHYLRIDDPANQPSLAANLDRLRDSLGATRFEYQAPDEYRLDVQLAAYAQTWPEPGRMVGSAHFYTPRDAAARLFAGRKSWLMEHFYRHMRHEQAVLMEPGQEGGAPQPAGGRWNFDSDNRKPWPGTPAEPPDRRPRHDHSALWATIEAAGVQSMGEPHAADFRWPLNRPEALAHLQWFIQEGLPHFGDYQDALSSRAWRLFHSLLSFALNTKMLRPQEVVAAAEAAWREGQAPLPAVEGFIRQILGWREYVRGVYWAQMPGYRALNALGHHRPLPVWFWTGQTQMRCLSAAITQTLEQAYAHHIQRLMVVGNFALLAGLDPAEVHAWYLGIYIDAFEWVELPNTLGMSQFADGGLLATKPYVSSAAYIGRMGDLCQGCHYRPKERDTELACPFNALYWDFHWRHRERLQGNHRLAMVYRQLDRMGPAAVAGIRDKAAALLAGLDQL